MNQNKDESAFPFVVTHDTPYVSGGLTKREYIATHVMNGLLPLRFTFASREHLAREAVIYADALLKELEKPTGAEVGNE
jgi:hypothetical protein